MAIGLLPAFVSHAADELFRLTWHGTVYTTTSTGGISVRSFSEREFIQRVAINNNLDPRTLAFVYRVNKHDTAVVRIADGSFVADVIQMEYNFTDISNANGTHTVRQAFLNTEALGAIGSAFGVEVAPRDSHGNLLSYLFHGNFQFSVKGSDPILGEGVYAGSFVTGARIRDRTGG